MKIASLPWGVFSHNGQSRDIYAKWFRFAAEDPNLEGVDLIDGPHSLFGDPSRKLESREVGRALPDLGLEVVMFVSHTDLRGKEMSAQEQDRVKYLVEQAVHFHAQYFRVLTGIKRPGELFEPEVMENVLRGLEWCRRVTAECGLPLLLENHHETTDELVTICQAFKGGGLMMNCEIKPPFRYGMDPQTFVERLIPFAGTYHIDNFKYCPSGCGTDADRAGRCLERTVPVQAGEINVRGILSAIVASGFDGWLSIEYGGPVDEFWHVAESASFVRDTWESLRAGSTRGSADS